MSKPRLRAGRRGRGLEAAELFGGANEAAAARKYRKALSALNAALNTTEVLMAAHRWAEINFAQVASLCLQRNRKAFLNEALKGKLSPAEEATGNLDARSVDAGSAQSRTPHDLSRHELARSNATRPPSAQ